MPARLSDQVIIDNVVSVIHSTGDTSLKNYLCNGKHSESTIIAHFGCWTKLLKLINIEPKVHLYITKDELVEDIKRVFEETNSTTRENYLTYGKYSRQIIKNHFPSWTAVLNSLDAKINMRKDYTDMEILENYVELCEEHNKILTAIEFRKLGKFSQPSIDRAFGSFTEMKKLLGLEIDHRFTTDEEIKEDILKLYNKYGFISHDLIDDKGLVSGATICNRFDGLFKLCQELGIEYCSEEGLSKFGQFVLLHCKEVFGEEYKLEHTFDWLKNPHTGKNLYIDIYYPSLSIAIEADGVQHQVRSEFFHYTEQQFKNAQRRDRIKDKLLSEHNIKVIRVPYDVDINNINKFLIQSKG